LADVVSGYFVPVVMGIALVAALSWYSAGAGGAFAVQVFITVLIIACPCSLGLATPAAIMVGTGRGAQLGVLFKSSEALEMAQRLDIVVLDKTGTITEGKPRVVELVPMDDCSEEEMLRLAAAVERHSEHPLATAIVRRAQEMDIEIPAANDFVAEVGKGAKAWVAGVEVRVGKASYLREAGIEINEVGASAHVSATQVWIAAGGVCRGRFALADEPRASSREGIKRLRRLGLDVAMLSGDKRETAEAIAQRVGIERVYAEVLPADKADIVKRLQGEGQCVAMVGDGVNDAPALAQADVGLAVASGTDVAAASAGIVLMNSRVEDIARAIELSRATMRTIRQNLFWAFFYNAIGLPVAAGLLYLFGGPLLNPMLASLAMAFSSVSVVANALRLRRFGME
jgi:Cu+-exporting ATPase